MLVQIQNYEDVDGFELIEPQSCKLVEINIGREEVPFLKMWESGQVLLSGIKADVFNKEGDMK